jgi:4-amino-4-deoxy-L-arabinose transferase-like glycosyltransferase
MTSSSLQKHNIAWDALALLLALLIYFAIGLHNLNLPGPNYDEVADAAPALEVLIGQPPVSALKSIDVLGHQLPLMMLHYIGPTSIYTSLAGFLLLGISVESLRITQLVIGALALVLLWLLARRWFDGATAALTVLLAGTAPAFIWWNRAGVFFSSPMLPIALGMLLALTAWWRTRRRAWLVAASFLFGLGMTTKLLFYWWLAPLVIVAVIALGRRGIVQAIRDFKASGVLLCITAFCAGFVPFILHNFPNLDSFRFVANNALSSRLYGHNNLDVANNIAFQATQLFRLASGDTLEFSAPALLPLAGIALVICLIQTVAWLIQRRNVRGPLWLPRLFLVVSLLTMLPLATISISAIGGRHLFILLPLVCLLIAASLMDAYRASRFWQAGAALVAVALIAGNLVTNISQHRFFEQTGGRGVWSDAINQLAASLEGEYAGRDPVAMDWGFERGVAVLTQGRVRMKERYEFTQAPSPMFEDMSAVLLRDSNHLYVFHAPQTTAFAGHWQAFERVAMKSRKQLVLEQTLTERDGVTNTLIYTAQPMARSFEAPASMASPRNATFDSGLTLLGGDVRYDPAKRDVAVMLHWQSNAETLPNDTVLLHIVDQSTGNVVVAADTQPVYGAYPFTQWQQGEVVLDPHWVSLPADLPAGVYQVRVGAYDRTTGQRRAINDPQNDAAGNSLMLHTFEVR